MSRFIIYALSYDNSDRFYIGKSSSGLERPRQHSRERTLMKVPHYPVSKWIRKHGALPNIIVLEECDKDSLSDAEIFYIAYFRSLGFKLLNLSDGGEGPLGLKQSEETKRKRADKIRGTKRSDDYKRLASIRSKEMVSRPGMCERIAASLRGRQRPADVVARVSARLRGRCTEKQREDLKSARAARRTARIVLNEKIGTALLSEWRAINGLSLTQAAKQLDIPLSCLHRIEKREPEDSRRKALAVSSQVIAKKSLEGWASGTFANRSKKYTTNMRINLLGAP